MIHLAEKHRAETAIAHRARFGELVGGFFEPEFHGRRRGNSAGDEGNPDNGPEHLITIPNMAPDVDSAYGFRVKLPQSGQNSIRAER